MKELFYSRDNRHIKTECEKYGGAWNAGKHHCRYCAHSCKNNEYHCAYIHVRNVSTAAGGIYKGNAHNDSNADNSPYDVVIFALNALFFFHYHDRYRQNDKAQKQRAYLVDSAFKHVGKNAYCKKHTDTHIISVIHHLFGNVAFFCQHVKDRWDLVISHFDICMCIFRKHTRNILIKTTACNMAAAFDRYATLFDRAQCLHINHSRC